MDEHQGAGMEGETMDGCRTRAVTAVADDGMPKILHVHPDLVLAAGFEFNIRQGIAGSRFDGLVAGIAQVTLFRYICGQTKVC